jgi:cytochrome c-type biogenesis protein CcmH
MKAHRSSTVIAALIAGFLTIAAASDDPAERLGDPMKETRARHLFQQLRCVVCQNESIDDSQAEIAGDLRRIVRAQIVAGRSDADIRAYLVQRYGEFILLKPTLSPGNLALWSTPFALILLGGGYLWIKSRRPVVDDQALSDEERQVLAKLDV